MVERALLVAVTAIVVFVVAATVHSHVAHLLP